MLLHSVTMRELGQKNRELEKANETIERLARMDALTGLANRRTLDTALHSEIARAERSFWGFFSFSPQKVEQQKVVVFLCERKQGAGQSPTRLAWGGNSVPGTPTSSAGDWKSLSEPTGRIIRKELRIDKRSITSCAIAP